MYFMKWLTGGLLLTSLTAALPAADTSSADMDEQAAQAAQLLAKDNPEEARAIYESLLEVQPDNPVYLTGLGRSQLQDHQALAASRTLREVIDKHPNHEPAYPLLQKAYYASGQSERAFGILQEARERFGERPWMESK